jgi:UDP-perosamine 4-acetyltransferase
MRTDISNSVFLLGCGGHGRVVLDSLLSANVQNIRVIDPLLRVGTSCFGVPVVPEGELLDFPAKASVLLVNGLGVSNSLVRRSEIVTRYQTLGYQFRGVIHPNVHLGRETEVHATAQVLAGSILQNRVRLGEHTVVNTGARIDHDCVVGAGSFVGPGAILSGGVVIEDQVLIGAGAVVLPGVIIARGARVGAGAVVMKDVDADSTVVGCPATALKNQT